MEPINSYGKLSRPQAIQELAEVVATLHAKMRELGALKSDFNSEWYPVYFRTPGNSVAAKEKEANYSCLQLLNDISYLECDIRAITAARDCLETIIPYAPE